MWLTGLLVLAVVAALVAGLVATGRLHVDAFDDPRPTPDPGPTVSPSPPAAAPVLTTPSAPATPAAPLPTDALERLLAAPVLRSPGAVVLDVATGEVLLDRDAAGLRIPASVSKLATGAAALVAAGPDTRFTTRVVIGLDPRELLLVGGGDPTLTLGRPRRGAYPRPASLAELAAATAAALRGRGTTTVTVRVDDGLFTGPSVSPDWRPTYVPDGVVSPVTALAVDPGRERAGGAREADPALAAGADFVRLLARHGVAVRGGVARATAAAAATELARVESPTVAGLVEQMLATSDNDLAEVLFRQVALARGRPGTFVDGRAEVAAILGELGLPTDHMRLLDGSGLARGSRVSPETVARLLAEATGDGSPALRPLVTGLPVAAFSGTLDDRLDEAGAGRAGAGLVRAKTGTLTGVDSLAGLATGASGRLLVFAVMADRGRPADVLRAQDGLDRFAAAVAVIAGDMGG